MKISITGQNRKNYRGFTLIEMIGVLAVIAILAAILIPKVFEAINSARINNATESIQTVKTAVADHYAKYGNLACSNTTPLTAGSAQFDAVLVGEGFLDKLFIAKISSAAASSAGTRVQLTPAITTAPDTSNAAYALGGNTAVNDATGSFVVQAVLPSVMESDARDLSLRLDGDSMSTALGTADTVGRVKYALPSSGLANVLVYITHR
jgi:prepilin-type N-terminal cleavage/methylation domain-containing protein